MNDTSLLESNLNEVCHGLAWFLVPGSCFTVGIMTAAAAATGGTGSMTAAAGGPAELLDTLVLGAGVVVAVIAAGAQRCPQPVDRCSNP
jgi:hypothetical protein